MQRRIKPKYSKKKKENVLVSEVYNLKFFTSSFTPQKA